MLCMQVPFRHRSFVQEHGRIVLSNPDMLHCTVLAGHDGPWYIKFQPLFHKPFVFVLAVVGSLTGCALCF